MNSEIRHFRKRRPKVTFNFSKKKKTNNTLIKNTTKQYSNSEIGGRGIYVLQRPYVSESDYREAGPIVDGISLFDK